MICGIFIAMFIDPPWPVLFTQYLGYFVLGWVIRKFIRTQHLYISLAISVFVMLSAFVITVAQENIEQIPGIPVYTYLSPFTICAAIALYLFFIEKKWSFNNRIVDRISKLAKNNLVIYFVHQLYIDVLYHWIVQEKPMTALPFLEIIVVSGLVYILSYATACVVAECRDKNMNIWREY